MDVSVEKETFLHIFTMQNLMNEIVKKKSICFVNTSREKRAKGKKNPIEKYPLPQTYIFKTVSMSVQVCVQIESKQMSLTLCVYVWYL